MIQLPKDQIKEAHILQSTVRYADLLPTKSRKKDTAVVFLAGQKSPLERFFPFSQYFAQFYHTYGYEIPGMGVQKRAPNSPATIKTMSQELAVFIQEIVQEPNVIVVAGSVGFWFTTEALLSEQKLRNKVKKIVSLVGVLGQSTFGFSAIKRKIILRFCKLITTARAQKIVQTLLEHDRFLNFYVKWLIRRRHLSHLEETEQQEFEEFERFLLKTSDWKIHFSTVAQYLTTDISSDEKLDIPLLSLYTSHDEYFPFENQKRNFEKTYSDITWIPIPLTRHAPLVVKDFHDYQEIIPESKIFEFLDK